MGNISIAAKLFIARGNFINQYGKSPLFLVLHPSLLRNLENELKITIAMRPFDGKKHFGDMLILESRNIEEDCFYIGMEKPIKL
jgi:hypothetical protein